MVFTSLIGLVGWTFEDPATFFAINYTNKLLSSIFILAFFTKAYAYVILMISQKYADPIRVTIIASTEPVITLILAVIIPIHFGVVRENLDLISLFGVMIIAGGAIVAGTGFMGKWKTVRKVKS
jgi:drug/metabolite transporter (DMT)-like permease